MCEFCGAYGWCQSDGHGVVCVDFLACWLRFLDITEKREREEA